MADAFSEKMQPTVIVAPPPVNQAESELETAPLCEASYVPRGQPPELNVDLSAMRALAMSSAQMAIDLSSVRSIRQRALGMSFGMICAFVVGGVLLYYALTTNTYWAAYSAISAFGLGTHWFIQRLRLLRSTPMAAPSTAAPSQPQRD